jgi:hypothetical protein
VTIELSTGHVGFCHVAAGRERAGDSELHPAPWTALAFVADPAEVGADETIVRLAVAGEGLAKTPTLLETILQDALYRPRVYTAFAVSPPDYDR